MTKPLGDFNKNRSTKDGLQYRCRVCNNETTRQHYLDNVQYYVDKSQRAREYTISYVKKLKESTPCMDCGISYPHFVMDFDHRSDKLGDVSRLVRIKGKQFVLDEIAKCDVVCSNCHRIRTHNRMIYRAGVV